MAFLGLELGVGLSAAIGVAVLAALWNYSSLEEADWAEIAAGAMLFVSAAGLEILAGSNGLASFTASAQQLSLLAPVLNLVGGLLVIAGGLRNSLQLLQER